MEPYKKGMQRPRDRSKVITRFAPDLHPIVTHSLPRGITTSLPQGIAANYRQIIGKLKGDIRARVAGVNNGKITARYEATPGLQYYCKGTANYNGKFTVRVEGKK